MTITELREFCQGVDAINLYMPAPNGRGYTRRLAGLRGPRGVIVRENKHGQMVIFQSKDILRYLDREEALAIHRKEDE